MAEAFVYCWTDIKTNKLYISSHKGTYDDGYICSSKLMLQEYNQRPNDFTRQIIAEGTYSDIRMLEYKILESVDAKNNTDFYNKHNGCGNFYHDKLTEEHKAKIKKTCLERSVNKGRKHKEESKLLMSKNRKGKGLGQDNYMYGRKQTEEQLKVISEKAKNRVKKTCPVCEKTMDISNYHRHNHGENCNKKRRT